MTQPNESQLLAGVARHAACFSPGKGGRLVEEPDNWGTFVVHIPIEASNLAEAVELARRFSAARSQLPQARVSDAAVSHRGNQYYRWNVYCNRPTDDGGCLLLPGHDDSCDGRRW